VAVGRLATGREGRLLLVFRVAFPVLLPLKPARPGLAVEAGLSEPCGAFEAGLSLGIAGRFAGRGDGLGEL
jgi:hypothetical protein